MQSSGGKAVAATKAKTATASKPTLAKVAYKPNDPANPKNWSTGKKWRCVAVAYSITFVSTFNASAQGSTSAGFRKEHPSATIHSEQYITTTFAFQLMLGLGPLVLAPISESFGRRKLLVVLTFLIMVLFLPQALAPNFASILATRFFQGACASVEGPVIAGIIADCFEKKDRSRAMATVLMVYSGNGIGPAISNWVAYRTRWYWVYWIQMMMAGVVFVLVALFLPETRDEAILRDRAARLEKETGIRHELENDRRPKNIFKAVQRTSTRPLKYLCTEPIVAACASWIGFAFGITFLFLGAVPYTFKLTHGFNQGAGGNVLICGTIGGMIGWIANEFIQTPLYRRALAKGNGRAPPEARLYSSAYGGILVAIGCFCFGWTARPDIFWFVPCIFIVMLQFGLYNIYLATYLYLADAYETFSSSAQAAQSLLRGIFGATFGFFGVQMYENLGVGWASSLIGFIFAMFAVVPFLLIPYGARLRQKSKVTSAIWASETPSPSRESFTEKGSGKAMIESKA